MSHRRRRGSAWGSVEVVDHQRLRHRDIDVEALQVASYVFSLCPWLMFHGWRMCGALGWRAS